MWSDDLIRQGQHAMTVCNACRYCEGYCPVFPAMENRLTFAKGDLAYLANLCHNCGECLYACQYAPPHEFGINVPRTLAEIRLASYEESCWPRAMSGAFTRQASLTAASLAGGLAVIVLAARAFSGSPGPGDFYQVIPHHVMVAIFSAAVLFAVAALAVARVRFWRNDDAAARLTRAGSPLVWRKPNATQGARGGPGRTARALAGGLGDALTLRHLHGAGGDCTNAEESRGPWRRWFHHCTFYGFLLCAASTSVAAIYHVIFGWRAPYSLTSVPVVLGTTGGVGLLIGPAGLLAMRGARDPALGDPAQRGLDRSFISMLFLTSATGLLLLALREGRMMPALLVVHLGFVLALFVMLPYGKFVHGIHRLTALVRFAGETAKRAS
jgi:citrate/tricarballylate utilization protein